MRYSDGVRPPPLLRKDGTPGEGGARGILGCAALSVAICLAWPSGGWADEMVYRGTTYKEIRIVDLESGQLAYRAPSGAFRQAGIVEIERLFVDSIGTLGDLNEAETRLAAGDYVRALVHYERAVRLATGFWKPLVRARYIRACDRADRIDTIAQQFVQLLRHEDADAGLVAELLPMTSPSSSRGIGRALRDIKKVIDDVPSQSGRVLLEMLRFHIVHHREGGDALSLARALVRQPIPRVIATRSVYRVLREALEVMIEGGDFDAVLRLVSLSLEDAPQAVLPELLLAKSRALLRSATDDETALRAGWAAMRVVIHYDDDLLVPEALLLAARVHERVDRIPSALQLVDECVRNARISDATKARANEMAKRLKSAG